MTMWLLSAPQYQICIKGTIFQTAETVKEEAARAMKKLAEEVFQHCFEQCKIRMKRCRDRERVYIEGDNN